MCIYTYIHTIYAIFFIHGTFSCQDRERERDFTFLPASDVTGRDLDQSRKRGNITRLGLPTERTR